MANPSSVAFDIGGTFTDIVTLHGDHSITIEKILSTPEILEPAVADCVDKALARDGHPTLAALLHATTLASNALLEMSGPLVGLLTTEGFRDELEIRRGARPNVYDFNWERIPPLIPRRRRVETPERIDAAGEILKPLDREATVAALETLARQNITSLAICFINAYANPAHEELALEIAAEVMPDVVACASHQVLPQAGEFERVSTTSVNAYLMPVVGSYLERVSFRYSNRASRLRIMQSNGGLMSVDHARKSPVQMVESGPAAGVLAAAALSRELGVDRAVSFDMGGTTVKASLIESGAPEERIGYEVGGESHVSIRFSRGYGYHIAVPSFDIVEAGAGGGSIARLDDGMLRVGPISAGADPGPAAYGNGGTLPTVTDANIVLGFINPLAIAGGSLQIDRDAAIKAIDEHLASQMGLDVRDVAHGIRQVANAAMLRSLRGVTSEKGRDPRQYSMIAFGGSGPVHAATLAEMAGMPTVYIPPLPGLFSAVGLLLADVRYDHIRALNAPLRPGAVTDDLVRGFRELTTSARDQATAEGLHAESLSFVRLVDLRYAGQWHETSIRLPEVGDEVLVPTLLEAFHAEHDRRFGYRRDEEGVMVAALRLQARSASSVASLQQIGTQMVQGLAPSSTSERAVYFGPEVGELAARVIGRANLLEAAQPGPAIVEEPSTTVVVPPGWVARLDPFANVILERA